MWLTNLERIGSRLAKTITIRDYIKHIGSDNKTNNVKKNKGKPGGWL